MKRLVPVAIAAVTLCLSGCTWGPRASQHPMLQSASGTEARLYMPIGFQPTSVIGELLAVDSAGVHIRNFEGRIVWVSYDAIRLARVEHVDRPVGGYTVPDDQTLRQLRLHARFPQGVSAALEKILLDEARQEELIVVRAEAASSSAGASAAAGQMALIEELRSFAAPFRDVNHAIASGYRQIGPDMPNMGEHWVNPRLAVSREIERSRPAMLTYINKDGTRMLTGVAYTVVVTDPNELPDPPFAGTHWHFHQNTILEEAAGHTATTMSKDNTGIAMLHAWLFVDNPDGVFAADNWALPYARLDMPVPSSIDERAARALHLLVAGSELYSEMLLKLVGVESGVVDRVCAELEQARSEIGVLVPEDASQRSSPRANLSDTLAQIWTDTWHGVARWPDIPDPAVVLDLVGLRDDKNNHRHGDR